MPYEFKITNANIKEWAKNYQGELFDGILCDPPYELGFMGKSWDSSGIAFDAEMWADIFKLLKPGGHLLAFSGSRTYHRMAVAIEDAGFEIRDQLIWMYGSGFPKSLNIGKAVDKIQGNKRAILSGTPSPDTRTKDFDTRSSIERLKDKGTSEWEGYGTALKPAHEPCVLARKPLDKGMTVAGNVLKHGTGGLNIDGTRVGGELTYASGKPSMTKENGWNDNNMTALPERTVSGRFPANLLHDGSDEVEAVFPQTVSKWGKQGKITDNKRHFGLMTLDGAGEQFIGDSGSASRYFYTAKASKRERNAGLEGFEEVSYADKALHTPKEGSIKKYGLEEAKIKLAENSTSKNYHPTVKPLSLTKYLATLIKPPTGGRLLVPFSGSGSEMIGALQAGWEYVEGVELTEEYIPIAEARIKYWMSQVQEECRQGVLL